MEKSKLEEIKEPLNEVNEAFARFCEDYGILSISVDGNIIFEKQQCENNDN